MSVRADAEAVHDQKRSEHWPTVEHHFRQKNPACPCGCEIVNVHHVAPYEHVVTVGRPDLELDERNLVTACETEKDKPTQDHHELLCHLGNFKTGNLDARNDLEMFKDQTQDQIKTNHLWQVKKEGALKPIHLMTDQDKTDFKALMDATYPLPEGVTPEMALQSIIDGLKKGK